jgi:transcription elongation factor Elf1
MFTCVKCQKHDFQITQLSEMRLLAECSGCGNSFVMDSISERKSWVEATDPNQHLVWNWKNEKWVPAKRP